MRLTTDECGPATLTTTGASIAVPSASVTPADPAAARGGSPPPCALKRNRPPARLGRLLQVAGGELRVVDVAAGREQHGTRDLAVAVAEGRVVGPARRGEALRCRRRAARAAAAPCPSPRTGCRARPSARRPARSSWLSAVLITTEPISWKRASSPPSGRPRCSAQSLPVVVALVGQSRAVQRRVVDPDHRGRGAGRAVAGGRQGVDVERAPALGARAPAPTAAPITPAPMITAS